MENLLGIYIALIAAGIILVCSEIYVPGGLLGLLGAVSLIAAIVMGFFIFSLQEAITGTISILILSGLGFLAWIRYFPCSFLGKQLMLTKDGEDFTIVDEHISRYDGEEGVAESPLKPAGIARILGDRVDVIANGTWIDAGTQIRVISVAGNHILVREIEAGEDAV